MEGETSSPGENVEAPEWLTSGERTWAGAHFDALLESPLDALLVVDARGRIRRVNARLEALLGYDRKELLGGPLDRLIPERYRAQHARDQAAFFARPRARPMGSGLDLFARHKSGAEIPVEISLTPLQTTGGDLVVAAIRDLRERKRSAAELARLGGVLESSLNEIYLFDARSLRFTLVNEGARRNLGYSTEELEVRTPLDLTPLSRAELEALLAPLRTGERRCVQLQTVHRRKDGSTYPVELHLQYRHEGTHGGDGGVFFAIALDVSERVQTQRALHESAQRAALHVEKTPLAVLEWRLPDGLLLAWNPAAERMFGYLADEVVGKLRAESLLVDDPALQTVLTGQEVPVGGRVTLRNRTKDGRLLLCEWSVALLTDEAGWVTRGAALVMDVTARQRALEALLSAQEEERARISRDLHDGVGQALTALGLGLNAALQNPSREALGALKQLVSQTLEDVRRISRDLRPALLDELGLEAAARRFARELAESSGLEVDLLVHLPERLTRQQEIVIYRVLQEALNNVVRHARAAHASVVLTATRARVQLTVEDDGVGFDVRSPSREGCVGLLGMRERLELLGGSLRLESAPGRGTTVSARLPLGGLTTNPHLKTRA
jgi:PAS domain S-box-containing protein